MNNEVHLKQLSYHFRFFFCGRFLCLLGFILTTNKKRSVIYIWWWIYTWNTYVRPFCFHQRAVLLRVASRREAVRDLVGGLVEPESSLGRHPQLHDYTNCPSVIPQRSQGCQSKTATHRGLIVTSKVVAKWHKAGDEARQQRITVAEWEQSLSSNAKHLMDREQGRK